MIVTIVTIVTDRLQSGLQSDGRLKLIVTCENSTVIANVDRS
jgi:hypothetical protein